MHNALHPDQEQQGGGRRRHPPHPRPLQPPLGSPSCGSGVGVGEQVVAEGALALSIQPGKGERALTHSGLDHAEQLPPDADGHCETDT